MSSKWTDRAIIKHALQLMENLSMPDPRTLFAAIIAVSEDGASSSPWHDVTEESDGNSFASPVSRSIEHRVAGDSAHSVRFNMQHEDEHLRAGWRPPHRSGGQSAATVSPLTALSIAIVSNSVVLQTTRYPRCAGRRPGNTSLTAHCTIYWLTCDL
jgi:hypothetical protein